MKDIFDSNITQEVVERINKLTPETSAQWGKMHVAQMLAHCSVAYEMIYEDKHAPVKGLKKILVKMLIKPLVVGSKPYKKNIRTAPAFVVTDTKIFDSERGRLIAFIERTQKLGRVHFENKDSNSFGPLSANEWNSMLYKHLDHHLTQFGA